MGEKELSGTDVNNGYEFDEIDLESKTTSDDAGLEEYGVWVKAGPEDIEVQEPDEGEFELQDLDFEEESTEEFLTEEEEELLGSLEEEIIIDEPADAADLSEDPAPPLETVPEDMPESGLSEVEELDDLDLDIDIDIEETLKSSTSSDTVDDFEIDTDTVLSDIDSFEDELGDLEIEEEGLESIAPVSEDFSEETMPDIEDLDLPDLEDEELNIEEDLADLDTDLQAPETIPTAEDGLSDLDYDDLEDSLESEELPELALDEEETETPQTEEESFDDVAAFQDELTV